jgi:sulfhydrogenase subunit delta
MDNQNPQNKKLAIGWFSFTCSEDSTILLTEVLNDHLDEWKRIVEFRHLKALKTKNSIEGLDVAFIEGAISSQKQEEDVKRIRDNAKYVVAIGSCACTGLPSASRNEFLDDKVSEKIKWYMETFNYNPKVKKLSDVIKVDDMVNGCPMNVPVFLEVLNKYLKLFNIT